MSVHDPLEQIMGNALSNERQFEVHQRRNTLHDWQDQLLQTVHCIWTFGHNMRFKRHKGCVVCESGAVLLLCVASFAKEWEMTGCHAMESWY